MAYSQRRDFLFCNYCGTMLNMESKFVTCPLCKFKRNTKEVAGKEISYTVTAEDIRRELGLSLFDTGEDNNKVQWSKVKKACEKCQNPEMHYTTRQVILSLSLNANLLNSRDQPMKDKLPIIFAPVVVTNVKRVEPESYV
ncbi:hypothetical protein EZV62_003700 [Acer yangbiense]|uniref:Uncharacterized protein n=1 Tax=Acer yangbiense TaxID=1000413 RepID=A0A5C7II59_9ROSI|nr:hypothetical protein EZV62_003700 [Acer yangbiense]